MSKLTNTIFGSNQGGYSELYPQKIRSFSKVDHLNILNNTNPIVPNNIPWVEPDHTYNEEDDIWDEDYWDDYF